MAWNAPRALKAPAFCRFSHLNQKRRTGFAGVRPSHSVPASSASVRGVDAMRSSVALVSTGVLWMKGSISLCAASTDSRVSGRAVDGSALDGSAMAGAEVETEDVFRGGVQTGNPIGDRRGMALRRVPGMAGGDVESIIGKGIDGRPLMLCPA